MGRVAPAGIGAICLLVMLAPSCSSGNDGGGEVPFDQVAAAYAAVVCHKEIVCCDANEIAGLGGGNPDPAAVEAACRTTFVNQMTAMLESYAPLISAGRIIYRGDRARRCFDEITAQPCAAFGLSAYLTQYPDCLHIYEGTIAPGGDCTLSEECADGICFANNGTACAANHRIDEACAPGACQPELSCLRDATGAPTVCATPLPDGATCYHDSNCASTFCVANVCSLPTRCNGV